MNELSPEELSTYEWQAWVPGVGVEGQRKLKGASVLVSRIGGVGAFGCDDGRHGWDRE